MELDKRMAEQMRRIEALQNEVFRREPSAEDANRPEALKRTRAALVRETIASLEKQKKDAIARFDAEIAARRAELASLEQTTDLDQVLRRGGRKTAVGKLPKDASVVSKRRPTLGRKD